MELKRFFAVFLLLNLLLSNATLFSQEVEISGFYQEDLLYNTRPGIAISYTKNYNSVFSTELEYGIQYINQNYERGVIGYSNEFIHGKLFMNNVSLGFLITVYNNNFLTIKLGSKPAVFSVFGNEDIHETYYEHVDTTRFLRPKDYSSKELYFKYAYSNMIKFKIKKVFISNLSANLSFSHGYILNGYRRTGCVVYPWQAFAPFGRINIGVSYNFNK